MVDFIKVCADGFHNILENEGLNPIQVMNAKRATFNVSTAALIGVVALGILGVLSLKVVVVLGAIALFGRVVAGQSLNLFSMDGIVHRITSFFNPSEAAVSFNGHVIFYNLA